MLSGPVQGRADNAPMKVGLVSVHQVILSSQAHNSSNVQLITTNLVLISELVLILYYEP